MRVRERWLANGDPITCVLNATYAGADGIWRSWNASTESSGSTASTWQRTEDVVTADFRKRIARGEIINNGYMRKIITESPPQPASFHHRTTKYSNGKLIGYDWNGPLVPFHWAGVTPAHLELSDVPGWSSCKQNAIDVAVTSANANVDTSELLALASAAEARKTVDMLGNIMLKVLKLARNVRTLNVKALRKNLKAKELANQYMEIRYGIRPLMYDTVGLILALEKERESIRRTYRGWGGGEVSHADTLTNQSLFYETKCDVKRTAKYVVSARAGIHCVAQLEAITNFGVDKIFETAWELAPFSFIVDWFVNVGDTIAALTPNAGISQLASWVTVKQSFTASNEVVNVRSTAVTSWNVDNYSTLSACKYGHEESVLERFVNPPVNGPSVSISLDAFKLLDLGIILKNVLRK